MTLGALLERYAQLERRGVTFYRGLALRFSAHPAAARAWRQLSDTEASHFALLGLAQDWVAMAGAAPDGPAVGDEAIAALSARMQRLEEAAAGPACTLADAVALTVEWEELELPRILELVGHLPARARGQIMAGIVGEAPEHHRLLLELVRASEAPGLADRVNVLAERCRAALG